MGMLNLLLKDPFAFLLIAIPLLYAIIFHELAHGWVAYRMGDPTAKMLGRLTLNPLKHLDPIGTLMLFIVGFGWAKPVPVNFNNLRPIKKGMILVSAAGIITNMIMAFCALFLLRIFDLSSNNLFGLILDVVARINIMLAAFNLIPIPPLDGSKIVLSLAPPNVRNFLLIIERYGFFIIIALVSFGFLNPVIDLFRGLIVFVINLLLP